MHRPHYMGGGADVNLLSIDNSSTLIALCPSVFTFGLTKYAFLYHSSIMPIVVLMFGFLCAIAVEAPQA